MIEEIRVVVPDLFNNNLHQRQKLFETKDFLWGRPFKINLPERINTPPSVFKLYKVSSSHFNRLILFLSLQMVRRTFK
jgi:hypothetical protein